MKSKKIKAIGFDLDDTLYEERKFVESGFRFVSKHIEEKFEINSKDFCNSLIKALDKKGRGKTFDIVLKKYNIFNKKLVEKLLDIYRKHTPEIKVYPEVRPLFKNLKKKYKTFLITDAVSIVQKNKIKALKLNNFFDIIVCTDDFKKLKPSPFPFKKAARFLKIHPSQMVYVGDDPNKDFIGAKKLGITTVRVKNNKGRLKSLKLDKEHEADYEIENIKKIEKVLKKINEIL